MQPGYGDGSPYEERADNDGPLPDYLQPGFAPRGAEPPRKSKLPWIIGAVGLVLIVAAVAVVLAV
ncbi:MAG: hypothetical protein QOI28_5111 [Mycobacterium sp.]|nr:hypothetical protein [Mycobacterium sp.]